MTRTAIFVDAGYLYAACSSALWERDIPRAGLRLNGPIVVEKLRETASSKAGDSPLLRIYWYDGVPESGPSVEQRVIAGMDDVKLRLGTITPYGQKGVDSLIVTDLVELARNRAVSDAVLLSGDEDVRIGVLIAQSFGVRVHLVGIEPSRGNQSNALMQESDTTSEWSKSELGGLLTLSPGFIARAEGEPAAYDEFRENIPTTDSLDEAVSDTIRAIAREGLEEIANLGLRDQIPSDYDRQLLIRARGRVGSTLDTQERNYLRNRFITAARDAVAAPAPDSAEG